MKHLIVSLALVAGFIAFSAEQASAVVCARGVYRAGCVGPRGAAVVRRPYVRAPYVRRPYVHRGVVVRRRVY
jgi:hypothetical protein